MNRRALWKLFSSLAVGLESIVGRHPPYAMRLVAMQWNQRLWALSSQVSCPNSSICLGMALQHLQFQTCKLQEPIECWDALSIKTKTIPKEAQTQTNEQTTKNTLEKQALWSWEALELMINAGLLGWEFENELLMIPESLRKRPACLPSLSWLCDYAIFNTYL